MAGLVIGSGVVLAGLGFILRAVAPELSMVASLPGMIGGGLCVLLGFAALLGYKRRSWTLLTLVAMFFPVLNQAVREWLAAGDNSGSYAAPLLSTLMLVLTVATLLYVMHGERPPEFYTTASSQKAR